MVWVILVNLTIGATSKLYDSCLKSKINLGKNSTLSVQSGKFHSTVCENGIKKLFKVDYRDKQMY